MVASSRGWMAGWPPCLRSRSKWRAGRTAVMRSASRRRPRDPPPRCSAWMCSGMAASAGCRGPRQGRQGGLCAPVGAICPPADKQGGVHPGAAPATGRREGVAGASAAGLCSRGAERAAGRRQQPARVSRAVRRCVRGSLQRPGFGRCNENSQVLEAALEAIRSLALNVGNVNWPAIERAAMGIVSERSPEFGEIQAVQFALTSLGDGHSHLLPAPTAASNALHAEDADIPHAVLGRASYVALPRFVAMSDDASSRFASRVRMLLDTASARPDHCGWILDLRSNSGGNMYPMLAGLWPLLGDGDLGHFDFPSGRKAWGMESGSFPGRMPSLRALPPATPVLQRQRVALLIGPRTASSGEIVAIAFAGRHGVRSFGHQTAGQASANRAVPLPDGSILALTVAQVSDRSGRVYPQGIEPDVRLPLPAVAANSSDEVALAATAWLEEGCR
ncbi:hypothetical protein FSC37_15815 [Piscinibacter aquaticus]|uniref:Tail specific protease domain-containing protein n=1 Tax=Piscinibacter aquaticus TaxID=392597 RepID=A0A5C6U1I3_9BURK|nr:hypothetical protein FSC37_15815 [Piscinibacter aquaticus]